MGIYIEPYALQNMLLMYCICVTSYRLLRVQTERWRIWAATALGVSLSLFYPLINLPIWASVAVKALGLIAVCFVLYAGKCKPVKSAAVFILVTLMFGGCVYFVALVKYDSPTDAFKKPVSVWLCVILAAVVTVFVAAKRLSVIYHKSTDSRPYECAYSLTAGGCKIGGTGYIDTGNLLNDGISGLPVAVISVKAFTNVLGSAQLVKLLDGRVGEVFEGARKLQCKSINGSGELWIFKPEKFEVYFDGLPNIVLDVMVGLSFLPLSKNGCTAILPPSVAAAASGVSKYGESVIK